VRDPVLHIGRLLGAFSLGVVLADEQAGRRFPGAAAI